MNAPSRLLLAATALLTPTLAKAQINLVPSNGECRPGDFPPGFGTVGAIVDSVGLLLRLKLVGNTATGLAAVHFDRSGRLYRVYWIEPPAVDSVASSLTPAIADLMRPLPREYYWGMRLRVAGGSQPAVALERSEYCPPHLNDQGAPRIEHFRVSGQDLEDLQRAGPWRVEMQLDTLGRIGRVNMVQSSGSTARDRMVMEWARGLRYLPASLDGRPFPARVQSGGGN